MSERRRQEIHCHGCNQWVQFVLDLSMNGNHVLHCPECQHEHCRVVKDGLITDVRWDSRNGPTFNVTTVTTSNTQMYSYTSATVTVWNTGGTTGGWYNTNTC
jgi:hypothetical protein